MNCVSIQLALARALRAVPHFRGKDRISRVLHRRLRSGLLESQAIQSIRMRDGSTMSIDVRSNTEWRSFYTGSYEDSLLSTVLSLLPKRCAVLDVGANIGFYTVPIGRRLKSTGGRVIAFEPVPENHARLVHNLEANGLADVVDTYQLALGEETREITMLVDDNHGATTGNAARVPSQTYDDGQLERKVTVAKMARLDDFEEELALDDLPCRFIKVDIEGNEPFFFRGAAKFLRTHKPMVLAEINPVWLARNDLEFADYAEIFRQESYSAFVRHKRGWKEIPSSFERFSHSGIHSILLVPPNCLQTSLDVIAPRSVVN